MLNVGRKHAKVCILNKWKWLEHSGSERCVLFQTSWVHLAYTIMALNNSTHLVKKTYRSEHNYLNTQVDKSPEDDIIALEELGHRKEDICSFFRGKSLPLVEQVQDLCKNMCALFDIHGCFIEHPCLLQHGGLVCTLVRVAAPCTIRKYQTVIIEEVLNLINQKTNWIKIQISIIIEIKHRMQLLQKVKEDFCLYCQTFV